MLEHPAHDIKQKKKIIKQVIKEVSETESEDEEIEEIIVKKTSAGKLRQQALRMLEHPMLLTKQPKQLSNNDKMKLVEKSAEDRLKASLKEDRINYLLNQIGAKI